ncbi:Multidrug resistance-associated protein [Blattamonas nauphoetae]|uniref:Multidrug resistance-associated protein n=1 Tax=Blattamonas nauphoetae TaxID=2049346 RepID=A0ABQ9X8Z7_9EUKA|nr:Multidrug resistance-associated protein [Blattamonas nauphoetae]
MGTTDSIASLTITGMLNYSTIFDTYSFTPRPLTNLPTPHLHIRIVSVIDRNPIEGRHHLSLHLWTEYLLRATAADLHCGSAGLCPDGLWGCGDGDLAVHVVCDHLQHPGLCEHFGDVPAVGGVRHAQPGFPDADDTGGPQLPYYMQFWQMTAISAGRIRDFLLLPEMKIEERAAPFDASLSITTEGGEFRWGEAPDVPLTEAEQGELEANRKEEAKKAKQDKAKTATVEHTEMVVDCPTEKPRVSVLTDVCLEIPTGSLTMVVGGVGSGKLSLTVAITGDVECVNGRVCVRGSIAFCPQIAWINNSTVRGRKTMPTMMLTMYMEAAMMMNVNLKRKAQFLYLPEMEEVEDSAETRLRDPSIAVEIEGASFKWGDAPAIPLTQAEETQLKKEAEKRKKEAKAAAALRAQTNPSSGFGHEMTDAPSTEPFTEGSEGVFKMAACNEDAMDGEFNEDEAASNTIDPPATPTMTPTSPRTPTAMSTASSGDGPTLQEMNISIRKGSLTMIVGEVGSGKSSFGAAIVGDIERMSGTVKVEGGITYCPQTPWIYNNTVRGNITFSAAFDEEKYWETVHGDWGEGVNLSGGQKARIQLARAMYSDRYIVVLDDPLPAVDVHVGRMLMDDCILGRLKGQTVVLMTNQIHFLDRADKVVTLKDGKIIGQGRYEELREQGSNFDEFINQKEKKEKKKEKEKKGPAQHEKIKADSTFVATQEEEQIKKLKPTRAHEEDAENTSTSADLLTNADEHDIDCDFCV